MAAKKHAKIFIFASVVDTVMILCVHRYICEVKDYLNLDPDHFIGVHGMLLSLGRGP